MDIFLQYFLAPVITAFLVGGFLWRWQQEYQRKKEVFDQAIRALAMYWSDCLDIGLQKDKPVKDGLTNPVYIRPETRGLLEISESMVKAYFSSETTEFYKKAARLTIGIAVSNKEAAEAKEKAVEALIRELNESGKSTIKKLLALPSNAVKWLKNLKGKI